MYSRQMKSSHLDTVAYEIDMLRFSLTRLGQAPPTWVARDKDVYIEAFLLHYRNLVRFFSGKMHRKNDLSMKKSRSDWAGRDVADEEAAKYTQVAEPLDAKYFDTISAYLQHCTSERVINKEWVFSDMYREIQPLVIAFEMDFLKRSPISMEHGNVANSTASVSQPLVRLSSLPRLDKP
jgi:hypothetical protein